MPAPFYQDDQPPFTQLKKRGETMRVLPTLLSYARSHAFKQRKERKPSAGEVWNCELGRWDEPNIAQRERAIGFIEGDTWALGLSDGVRCELIERAMDRHMMAWLGGMMAALNRP